MPNIASFLRTLLGRNVSRARSLRDMPNKPMFERGMAGPKLPNTRDIDMLRKTSHVMTPAYIEEFAKACRDAGIEKSAAGILLRCAAEARSPAWAVKAANWRERGIDPVWAGIVALKCGRSKAASAFKSSLPLMSDSGDGGALKANFKSFLKHPIDETRRLFNGGTLPGSGGVKLPSQAMGLPSGVPLQKMLQSAPRPPRVPAPKMPSGMPTNSMTQRLGPQFTTP